MRLDYDLPRLGITMGDPSGVGPEIIAKVFASKEVFEVCHPLILGDKQVLTKVLKNLGLPLRVKGTESPEGIGYQFGEINIINLSELQKIDYGYPQKGCAEAAISYIKKAVSLAMEKEIDGMITCPISKKALSLAGFSYPGHTELLAELTSTSHYAMMLAGDRLKVVLVTRHQALREVPSLITSEKIITTIRITHEALRRYFGIPNPRIAIAALNPHAGEEGLLGEEEERIIKPAVVETQRLGIKAIGPLPADSLSFYAFRGDYDAVISMYHDQGLGPLKIVHFEDAVNITLGLPIIRTSVAHGTAYDIAGTGKASPRSLFKAIRWAAKMSKVSLQGRPCL